MNCTFDVAADGGGGGAASIDAKLTLLAIKPGDAVREELELSAPLLPLVTGATEEAGEIVGGPFSIVGRTCVGR